MHHLLRIPSMHYVAVHDQKIFVDFKRLQFCSCGGYYSIRRKQHKKVRHSLLHQDTLYLHLTITYYRCDDCRLYHTDDGGLGVQHQTTALYRQLAVELAELTTLSFAARLLNLPKSTLAGWRNK